MDIKKLVAEAAEPFDLRELPWVALQFAPRLAAAIRRETLLEAARVCEGYIGCENIAADIKALIEPPPHPAPARA